MRRRGTSFDCHSSVTTICEVFISNFRLCFSTHPPLTAAETRTRIAFYLEAAARRGASLRRADAAQVCNNIGFAFIDGVFECTFAKAARQIVSERW